MNNPDPDTSAPATLSDKEKADREKTAELLTEIAAVLRTDEPIALVFAATGGGVSAWVESTSGDDLTDSTTAATAKVALRSFKRNAKAARSCA